MRKRQEYLRAQRDKLVALKKEARQKQLDITDTASGQSVGRPRSAKAARACMTGAQVTVGTQELLIRKTLAERLRSEVVEKEKN